MVGTDCEIFAPSERRTAQCPGDAKPVTAPRGRAGAVFEDVVAGRQRVTVPVVVEADAVVVVAGAELFFLLEPPHAVARTRTERMTSEARATVRPTSTTAQARR